MNFKISIIVPFFYKERIGAGNTPDFDLLSFNKCLSAIFKSKYNQIDEEYIKDYFVSSKFNEKLDLFISFTDDNFKIISECNS